MVMTAGFCVHRIALLILVVGIVAVTAGIHTAYAATQTVPTEDGTLNVRLEYPDAILPDEETKIRVDFLNPVTGNLQEHIDYTISVTQADQNVFGPTTLIHTSPGTITVPLQFQREGTYSLVLSVEGILFSPIPPELVSFDIKVTGGPDVMIPAWIKNSAGWWADGDIDDATFVSGIQYLIKNGILVVPSTDDDPNLAQQQKASAEIPAWIRINAGWWADGDIDDATFIGALEYLIQNGILVVPSTDGDPNLQQ